MVWSKYNYLFKSSKFGFLLYNSLSNSFAELNEEAFLYLKEIERTGSFKFRKSKFINYLIEMKALVNNDKDMFYKLQHETYISRYQNSSLNLTINPTLKCNFSCSYCFEENKAIKSMNDEVEDAIINFIKNKQLKKVHITWFGGEPLLEYNRIKSITKKIKELDIIYSASLITNGYLFTEKVINSLDNLEIKHIQITLDGLSDFHDKRRCLKSGKGTFHKIIKNLDIFKKKDRNSNLVIRVNVDLTNQEEFIKVYDFIKNRYNSDIFIYPGFVCDVGGCKISDCMFDRNQKVQFLIEQYKKYNYIPYEFHLPNNRSECTARISNSFVIGPEGEIYKCWFDVGNPNQIIGSILRNKKTNDSLITRYMVAADPFNNEECISCFYLPICNGGCPHSRIVQEYSNIKIDTCIEIKDNLEPFLEFYYEINLNK